jgi:ABC-type nitrate/sulfonate/bicarbonate transport system substrate-binding protein
LEQTYNIDDLINGQTDAISAYVTNEPWYLKQKGIEPGIIWPKTYGVDFYSDCLFTTDMEIENHPERVKQLLKTSLAGWDYAMAHPEEIIDILIANYSVKKSRDHLLFEARAMQDLIFPTLIEMGHMNEGRWRHIADTFALLGDLQENFNLKGYLYDPDPQPDIQHLKYVIFSLILGIIAASLLIIYIIKINHQLSKEAFFLLHLLVSDFV